MKTKVKPTTALVVVTAIACAAAAAIAVGVGILSGGLPAVVTGTVTCGETNETISRDVPSYFVGKPTPLYFNPVVHSTSTQYLNGRPYGAYYGDTCLIDVAGTMIRKLADGTTTTVAVWQSTKVDSCTAAEMDNITKRNCRLQEGFCTGTNVSNYIFACPNGCLNGACVTLMNVSVSPTPPAGAAAAGTTDYTFANLVFNNATTTDLKISQVKVTISTNKGYPANLSNSTLWDGNTKLTMTNNPDSELAAKTTPGAAANAVFILIAPLTIPAGGSKTLTYKANLAAGTAGGAEISAGLRPGAEPVIKDLADKNVYSFVNYSAGQKMTVCGPHNEFTAYYKFDGNVSDSSGSQANGAAFGPIFKPGQVGQALQFDGVNDYVALPLNYCGNYHQINQLTTCAWFYTTAISNTPFGNWAFIDFDRSEYFDFYLNETTGQLGFSTHSKSPALIHDLYSQRRYLYDSDWHFGCAVYDHGKKYFYVDGELDYGQGNVAVQTFHSGAPLESVLTRYGFIGDGSEAASFNGLEETNASSTVTGRNNLYYNGRIDELRLYEKVLPEAEMKNLYLTGLGLNCDPKYLAMGIDPENLTGHQKEMLATFPAINTLTTDDISVLESYGLNPNNLSICDKIYVMQKEAENGFLTTFIGQIINK